MLRVPHQGGDTSLTTPFMEAARPEAAVISAGADSRFGYPDEVTLEELDGMPSYRSDQQGSVEVVAVQ